MKLTSIFLLFAIAVSLFYVQCRSSSIQTPAPNASLHEVGNLIIFYDSETGKNNLFKAIRDYGATVVYNYEHFNALAVRIGKERSLEEAIEYFRKVPGVLTINKDELLHFGH